jgi:hypothetical protein
MRGTGLPREALSANLAGSRVFNAESTRQLLAELEDDGLIRGDAKLDLTAEGQTLYASLNEYVSRPTIELLSQFDIEDIDTTVRTLQASPNAPERTWPSTAPSPRRRGTDRLSRPHCRA